ncbi:hypothetical protein NQ036_08000 [Brevibacterium sp. 91QC2O2]|uniref:hypothetical protein n=1 Tax=Brevibacterium moorei TaxID=2968457 RepID=UPI00211B9376|nr:hypothetical protein [Brevibacterium sp. 68QC2CO]MCQ9368183.1 hypothetical protein [Brevibacterium sp. 91QC2O2]MCQ9385522.1 hypothetical protein [Brevibacterium sp. 68QC2CO]
MNKQTIVGLCVTGVGIVGVVAACVYLVALGYQADASLEGGGASQGWWELGLALLAVVIGQVLAIWGGLKGNQAKRVRPRHG